MLSDPQQPQDDNDHFADDLMFWIHDGQLQSPLSDDTIMWIVSLDAVYLFPDEDEKDD